MATISQRKRADGSVSYTAQIRIRRNGAIVYQESKTFDQKKPAERWAKQRELYIESVGVNALRDAMTIGEAVQQYIDEVSALPRGIGRSKMSALKYMLKQTLADLPLVGFSSAELMNWMRWRASEVSGSTVSQDVIFLKQVLEYARSAWGRPVDLAVYEDAVRLARRYSLITRSEVIERRPTLDELDLLLTYYSNPLGNKLRYLRDNRLPMIDLILFQIFSTRRVSETCRIEWSDLDVDGSRVLVRDMKHPRKKEGNHKWVHLTPRALAIAMAQPRVDARIFPYGEKSVAASFQRTCRHMDVMIGGLRLHDLRHEGTSHLFELGWDIPRVAMVTGHGSWDNLKRYTHLVKPEPFDKYAGWSWLGWFGVE